MSHIRLKAVIESIPVLLDFVSVQCSKNSVASEDIFSIMLILEELATNICHYAYPDAEGDFEAKIEFFTDRCSIKIIDSGISFDPTAAQKPDTESPIAERKIGGMGLLLVRENSDEFQYRRIEGRNVVKVIKILKGRTSPILDSQEI